MINKSEINNFEYENLIDMFPSASFVIRDSIITYCNDACVNVFEFESKDEIIGKKHHELCPDIQPDGIASKIKIQDIIKYAQKNHRITINSWMHRKKNGDLFQSNMDILNKDGNLYVVLTDVNHKGTNKDYIYHVLFENHTSIMMLVDPNTGRILEVNEAAVMYYGYNKEKLLSMNVDDISPSTFKQIRDGLHENTFHFQSTHILNSGEQREVEVYCYSVELEGKKLLFAIVNDISDKLNNKLMYDSLFLNSPYAVVILDREQRIVNINKNFTEIFQYELHESKGKYINELVSSKENKRQIDNNLNLIYHGKIIKQEGMRKRKDGKLVYVEIIGYPVISRDTIVGVYIMYKDISDKKAYQDQLKLFKKILESISEGVIIADINGHVEWINSAFERITGYSLKEIRGKNMNTLRSEIQDQSFYVNMWNQLVNGQTWNGELWSKSKDGNIYPVWSTIYNIKDSLNRTTHYVGILRDLSEKIKIDRRMEELQQKDILTGLYNRSYFLKLVDEYIKINKEKEKFSIIYIDLEDFKEINNSLGHHIGDKLLIELSKRLQLLTNGEHILSRYGGNNFVILYKSVTEENQLKNVARKILESLKQPIIVENTVLNVLANIGISRFPEDGKDGQTLITHAEIAMYKSKGQLGEKIYFYSKDMYKEIQERFRLANQLTKAIGNGELNIHYQPIFNINNPKNIVGLEALLRWESPLLGRVSPDKFIPVAEKTGYIIYIGQWVLEQVCRQINIWKQKNCHVVPISVNISVEQLEEVEFSKRVIDILERYGVEPNNIEFEITESVSTGDLTTIVQNLKELKKYGIKISMDDFGTGFSSLGQIDLFELDKLKIDKIFINDILNITKKQNLVKSIIAMAKSLNLTVVAEGIETQEQLTCLRQFGCHLGQGYLISKPLPVKEVETLLNPYRI